MTTELAEVHNDLFNYAEGKAQEIICALPDMTDEELLETRRSARGLGQVAWRIECEADREIVKRGVERGNKKATVEDAAKEAGVTSQTIYLNARVADVVDNYCKSKDVLTLPTTVNIDKSLVVEALEAPNPTNALAVLVENRENAISQNKTYSSRDAKRDVAAMKVKRADIPMPEGKYQVILADPPWRYDFGNSDNRIIENHYPTMELEDICALDIPALAADDSILFLWTTSPKLEQSFEVIRKWGFEYKTCMIWDKEHIGMGYYFRQQHELLLVCKRGNLPAPEPSTRPPSVLRAARGKHSEKPDELYDLLECMYPHRSKLELFCRRPRDGWTVWGNEV